MVRLEEIVDVASDHSDDEKRSLISDSSSESASDISDNEDVSDDEGGDETLMDRIHALIDIIPAHRRVAISHRFSTVVNTTKSAGWWVGQAAWVVSTTVLMVVVPLAVEMERDAAQRAWEKEMMAAQQGGGQGGIGGGSTALDQFGIGGQKPVIPAGF